MRPETTEVAKVRDFRGTETPGVMMGVEPAILVTAFDAVRA